MMKVLFMLILIAGSIVPTKVSAQTKRYISYEWATNAFSDEPKYNPFIFHVVLRPDLIEVYMTHPIVLKKIKEYPAYTDSKGRKVQSWDTIDSDGKSSSAKLTFINKGKHIATLVLDYKDVKFGFRLTDSHITL